jgi:chromosome partitioning protein
MGKTQKPSRALVITVAGLKGGVGKSTITMNIASALHIAGTRVLVVDADPQGTCRTWAARAGEQQHEGPPVVAMDGAALRRDLATLSSGFAVVVIDSPPRVVGEARYAMLAADLVVMPVTPGVADVWALRDSVAVLEDARSLRPELRAVLVLNRADRTQLAKATTEALESLGVPVLPTRLAARVAFGEAMAAGQGVMAHAPGTAAALEVRALTEALLVAARTPAQGAA